MKDGTRELLQALLCCELRAYEMLRKYERVLQEGRDDFPGADEQILMAKVGRVITSARADELEEPLVSDPVLSERVEAWQRERSRA